MTERQRVLLETAAARDRAAALLRELMDTRAAARRAEPAPAHVPPDAAHASAASLDRAIQSARALIESLNRSLDMLRGTPEDEVPAA